MDTRPSHHAWLIDVLGLKSLSSHELTDPFTLLQALSLAFPSATDLSWYTSDEAFNCDDLEARTVDALRSGLHLVGINVRDNLWRRLVDKDALAGDELLDMIWSSTKAPIVTYEIIASGRQLPSTIDAKVTENAANTIAPTSPAAVTDPDADDKEDFQPTEPAFIPAAKWLLGVIKSQSCLSAKCKSEISQLQSYLPQDCKTVPFKILKVLCSGIAYQLACDIFINSKRMDATIVTILLEQEFNECFFLDTLMSHGYLNVPKRLSQNIKEMVVDVSPFYESIHAKILEALMTASWRDLKVGAMVAELQHFQTFDPTCMYPYDVPDALHIWSHQIITQLIHRITNSTITKISTLSTLLESTDLLLLTQDGRAVAAVLSYYYEEECDIGGIHIDSSLSDSHIVANWEKIKEWSERVNAALPPWSGENMATCEGNRSEAFRGLVTMYFAGLYRNLVLNENVRNDGCSIATSTRSNVAEQVKPPATPRNVMPSTATSISTINNSTKNTAPSAAKPRNKNKPAESIVTKTTVFEPSTPSVHQNSSKLHVPTTPIPQPIYQQQSTSMDSLSSTRRVKLRDRGRAIQSGPQFYQQVCTLPPIHISQPTSSIPAPVINELSTVSLPPIAGAAEPSSDKSLNDWSKQSSLNDVVAVRLAQDVVPISVDLPMVGERFSDKAAMKQSHLEEKAVEEEDIHIEPKMSSTVLEDKQMSNLLPKPDSIEAKTKDSSVYIETETAEADLSASAEFNQDSVLLVEDNDESQENDQIIVHQSVAHLLADDNEEAHFDRPADFKGDDGWRTADEVMDGNLSNGDYYDIPSGLASPGGSPLQPHIASFSLSETLAAQNDTNVVHDGGGQSRRKGGVTFEVNLLDERDGPSPAPSVSSRWPQTPATAIATHVSDLDGSAKPVKFKAQRSKTLELQHLRKEDQERYLAEQRRLKEEEERRRLEERFLKRKSTGSVDEACAMKGRNPEARESQASTKQQSNRQLIRNALVHLCLAGSVNEKAKEQVLEDLDCHPGTHFIILFPPPESRSFRGLYTYDPTLDIVYRISAVNKAGTGPDRLLPSDISAYYKYDSGAKEFKKLEGCKGFGRSVSAVALGRDFVGVGKKAGRR
ncbi:hypothetical protein SeMB42_g04742 [Synchytrium endobioticum]|uniref:CKK domain-containing protein n=1 Tax=Synchytrium endobioticum TaxID=286115 RepID=A0A507CW70_9FUNG|nr:hypothetical protein SeLEV6574_g05212 [Synchytrium endobioticum]TPX43375.1 hypothetical protein SeMB42_g04742 [Synchytrium endobioticum]